MWLSIWHYIIHWFQFNYVPSNGPFYTGATWGNVFVVAIAAPIGWLWSKTKFWPLRPIEHGFKHLHDRHDLHDERLDALIQRLEALHEKHDSLHTRLDHHDNEFEAIKAKIDPQSPPSPSE